LPPLCRTASDASTPGGLRSLRPDGANRRTCSALGVSHPLGGLLRIGAAGLLHPAAGYGVRRVSRGPPHHLEGGGCERSVPRAAVTLRRVPLVSSRAASLRSSASLSLPSVLPVQPAILPKKKGGSGPPAVRTVGLPRGRRVTGATLAGGRSRRIPGGYLPLRPRPGRNLHPPKLVEAHPCFLRVFHRGGGRGGRDAGASCPSEGPGPAEAGRGPSGRVFGADRGRHRGARGTMGLDNRGCRASSLPERAG
jgi:hypothetical protein